MALLRKPVPAVGADGLMGWLSFAGWGGLLVVAAIYGLGYRDANGRKPPAFLLFGGLALGLLVWEGGKLLTAP